MIAQMFCFGNRQFLVTTHLLPLDPAPHSSAGQVLSNPAVRRKNQADLATFGLQRAAFHCQEAWIWRSKPSRVSSCVFCFVFSHFRHGKRPDGAGSSGRVRPGHGRQSGVRCVGYEAVLLFYYNSGVATRTRCDVSSFWIWKSCRTDVIMVV